VIYITSTLMAAAARSLESARACSQQKTKPIGSRANAKVTTPASAQCGMARTMQARSARWFSATGGMVLRC
jgi:hypothetical protein